MELMTPETVNNTVYNFQLKKVSECKALSDETPCFSADLYANGKKICTISNQGHGGPDFFSYPTPALSAQWGAYEDTLSEVVYKLLDMREREAFVKKHQKNCLVIANDWGCSAVPYYSGGKRLTIEQLLSTPRGRAFLQRSIDNKKAEGYRILNTNLNGMVNV